MQILKRIKLMLFVEFSTQKNIEQNSSWSYTYLKPIADFSNPITYNYVKIKMVYTYWAKRATNTQNDNVNFPFSCDFKMIHMCNPNVITQNKFTKISYKFCIKTCVLTIFFTMFISYVTTIHSTATITQPHCWTCSNPFRYYQIQS